MQLKEFWKSVLILLKNYHAVNRKIFACKIESTYKVLRGIEHFLTDNNNVYDRVQQELMNGSSEFELRQSEESEILQKLASCDFDECEGCVVNLKFLTKSEDDFVEAIGILNFLRNQYTCTFKSTVFDDFQVSLTSEDGELIVNALTNRRSEPEANRWVDFVLKPKLLKWSQSAERKENVFDSLHLVDVEKYNSLYKQMKAKYSKELFDIWQEESTDPFKFIYEDLAIASYLICLWRDHHCEPNEFVDLGCGNGLLVYILNREGYQGCGYDVRSRKIWSRFPRKTLLLEETITPNRFEIPPTVDWVIGNHSDELSPWIPVLAALPTYKVKYFLLPCCPFEFSGLKFQRRNSKLSSYNDFLSYVHEISEKCGFITLRDRLKIPSTKRIALIGINRTYAELSHEHTCSAVQEFISTEMKEHSMKFRERQEVVRNCTQIDSTVLNGLVLKIFFYLLNSGADATEEETDWKEGGKRSIREIAQNLTKEELQSIKSECGGLKTLLKNKHEVFQFSTGDQIQIRRPRSKEAADNGKQLTLKKRACFFATNHPNGCPLSDSQCTFIHHET